jgi:iron complex transport system permease protein
LKSVSSVSAAGLAGERRRAWRSALVLFCVLCALVLVAVCRGSSGSLAPPDALRALGARFGLVAPDSEAAPALETIVGLRLWRALVAAGVGAALALSGGLIQGLFRNGLASPSLLGVTGGAALGAALAILAIGGYGPRGVMEHGAGSFWIPLFGFVGALATVSLVAALSSTGGRTSVPTLLLVGIAVNMAIAGVFAALQSFALRDWEVSRAILSWTFGTLDDRSGEHAAVVWGGLALAAAAIPFVAVELDLFRGGEADAQALGVDTGRVKLVCLLAAALAASAAVAVAGQIVFVGLVVPHLVRFLVGSSHRVLLPICVFAGAVFLLGAEVLQRLVFGEGVLQPGVLMSLVGGPFFLFVLIKNRRELGLW